MHHVENTASQKIASMYWDVTQYLYIPAVSGPTTVQHNLMPQQYVAYSVNSGQSYKCWTLLRPSAEQHDRFTYRKSSWKHLQPLFMYHSTAGICSHLSMWTGARLEIYTSACHPPPFPFTVWIVHTINKSVHGNKCVPCLRRPTY